VEGSREKDNELSCSINAKNFLVSAQSSASQEGLSSMSE
jgi:hypothetical protein